MKKSLVARGFIGAVASLLGVAAVGCGAATDQEAAEIGSTEQALSTASSVKDLKDAVDTAGSDITDPVARHWPASCKVTISSVDYMLLYGGYDNSGNALDELFLYTPGTPGTWTKLAAITDTLNGQGQNDTDFDNQERGQGQFLKLNDTDCLLVGGFSKLKNGTARVRSFKVHMNSTTSVTWSKAGDLHEGRAMFGLAKCGTGSNAIVFGGSSVSATNNLGSPINSANSIEVWDGSTTWTAKDATGLSAKLNPRVAAFGFAEKDDHSGYVVAGGYDGSGAKSEIQTFTVDNSCSTVTKRSTGTLKDTAQTPVAEGRIGAAAMIAPGTSDLIVVAGDDNSNLVTHAELFTVPFSASAFSRSGTLTSLTGTRLPTIASNGTQFVVVGGEARTNAVPNVNTSAPISALQEFVYSSGAWTHGTDGSYTARSGAPAEYLNSASLYYAATGLTDDSPFTLTTITESF